MIGYIDTIKAPHPLSNSTLTYQITSTLPSVKYYYLGSQRVAMRGGNDVYYLHGDHLGSTSLTTNVTGTVVAETRHHPFGEVRWESGSRVTDFGFTGQRNEVGFGLMDYKARFYSPGLGRFVSADTVVPDFGNSQGLNRYSYVYNNPLKFVDPSGNCAEWEGTRDGLCTHSIKTTQKIRLSNDEAIVAGPPQLKFIVRGGTVFRNKKEVGFANYILSSNETFSGNEGFLPPPSGLPAMDLTALNNASSALGYETLGNAFGFDILSEVIGGTPQAIVGGSVLIGGKLLGTLKSHWKINPSVDLDWRGTNRGINDALNEAFNRTGVSRDEFEITKWGRDVNGKSWPAEWRVTTGPNRGAEVNVDWSHTNNGPSVPHVGYQTPGKRGSGGAVRGHILLDEVPYNR